MRPGTDHREYYISGFPGRFAEAAAGFFGCIRDQNGIDFLGEKHSFALARFCGSISLRVEDGRSFGCDCPSPAETPSPLLPQHAELGSASGKRASRP